MSPVRLAIVGFGKIARDQHLQAIEKTDGIELVAIASRHAGLEGLPHYTSIHKLLAEGPAVDAVALCAPPQVRHDQAAAALAAGKHVLLEKPPGATVSELVPLIRSAKEGSQTLFATWHSRFAPAVEPARAFLAEHGVRSVEIEWKEDVRVWHPGQDWIWQPGGLGVFDPGINALSILTKILPEPVFLTNAELAFPGNCDAPIAADLVFSDSSGRPVRAAFDFRQTGPQTWDIRVETDAGRLVLGKGGATLSLDGKPLIHEPEAEYASIYKRFVQLIGARESDVDLSPLQLVADAFLLGRRVIVEDFED